MIRLRDNITNMYTALFFYFVDTNFYVILLYIYCSLSDIGLLFVTVKNNILPIFYDLSYARRSILIRINISSIDNNNDIKEII